ncbi:TetR/AcrR family transcriptional regulator [Pseudodesulfovibrio sp. zrk46]|uniref:TetR/AcrR family transcriptional regulator n=1 Tax=Pseudodesulfovibrio sp. zrk46 TaxID=2725288 RepID=UPI001449F03D|nr:TetR/AcrR family transcriptional regulator [Pseudodesulfovibrio sp. zrk46]QJB57191.1 TetR/AcrR family transcriptional regulator [Pseudodesulfovibrio sp. zrk46]
MGTDTKNNILLAAVKVFAEHGYQAATIRQIVDMAGAKNLNAVVYYFGSKQDLYKAVMEFMFLEAEKFKDEIDMDTFDSLPIEERLASMIRFYCKAYYSIENDLDSDLFRIFVNEARNSSPFFNDVISRHLKPSRDYMCSLLKEYLGPDTPDSIINNCEYSITAQILYGALGWSIISGTVPEQKPFAECVEELAEHVVRFSLAALATYKNPKGS